MTEEKPTRWWRRLQALAELAGDFQQQDIAERLGVSTAAVTKWKHGQSPSPEVLLAAAEAYGVDALELMRIVYIEEDEPTRGKGRRGVRKLIRGVNGTKLGPPRLDKPPL